MVTRIRQRQPAFIVSENRQPSIRRIDEVLLTVALLLIVITTFVLVNEAFSPGWSITRPLLETGRDQPGTVDRDWGPEPVFRPGQPAAKTLGGPTGLIVKDSSEVSLTGWTDPERQILRHENELHPKGRW